MNLLSNTKCPNMLTSAKLNGKDELDANIRSR